jgi:hypothetical protein
MRRKLGSSGAVQEPAEKLPAAEPQIAGRNREMAVGDEGGAGLAPDEPPSWGQGAPDLAEWLACINLGGGGDGLAAAPTSAPMPAPASPTELSVLVERWVKRVALGGDQRRGVARLDIGQGRFAGTELLIVAEAGQVSVELNLPAHESEPGLGERLRDRLERRGLSAEVVVR